MDVEAEGSTAAQVMPFEVLNYEPEPYVRVVEIRSVKVIAIKVSTRISFHLLYSENNTNHTRTKVLSSQEYTLEENKALVYK